MPRMNVRSAYESDQTTGGRSQSGVDPSAGIAAEPQSTGVAGAGGTTDRFIQLFGIDLCDTTCERAASWLVERAAQGTRSQVAFVNAHCVNVMYRDAAYRNALLASDRIFVDGAGMKIAARSAGIQLRDNVNGTDLFPVLCRRAALAGVGLYLFGGSEGVASEAGARMVGDIDGLRVAGAHHGYVGGEADETRLIGEINASGAQIVLVGLGVPSQEMWIARNRSRLDAAVVIGVGGLFDYYSGRIARAPMFMRRAGLEWFWRLAQEPRRLARRYLLGNLEFMIRVALLKLAASYELRQPTAA